MTEPRKRGYRRRGPAVGPWLGCVDPECGKPHPRGCHGHVDEPDGTIRPCEKAPIQGAVVCYSHGGASPQVKRAAGERVAEAKARELVAMFGTQRKVHPVEGILDQLGWVAGRVYALRERVQLLEADAVTFGVTEIVDIGAGEFTGTNVTRSAAVNIWIKLLQEEEKHYEALCLSAIKVGIDERQIRLAEMTMTPMRAMFDELARRAARRFELDYTEVDEWMRMELPNLAREIGSPTLERERLRARPAAIVA